MGDLLFFVYTSTPHRHRVPPEQLPEQLDGAHSVFLAIRVIWCGFQLFIRVILHEHIVKREPHFATPFSHCNILSSCIFRIRLNASSRSIGTLMPTGAWNRKPDMLFSSALNSSVRTACAVLMKSPLILGSHFDIHHSGRFSRVSVSKQNSRLRLLSYMGAMPVMRIVSLSKRKPTFPK